MIFPFPDATPSVTEAREFSAVRAYLPLSCLPSDRRQTRRNVAMTLFMLGAGTTTADVSKARVDSFDLSGLGVIFHTTGANGSVRTVELDDFSVMPVRNWLEEVQSQIGGKFAFPTHHGRQFTVSGATTGIIDTLKCINLGETRITPNLLRSVWCQRQLLKGTDLKVLQRQMGLESLQLIYRIRRRLTRSNAEFRTRHAGRSIRRTMLHADT